MARHTKEGFVHALLQAPWWASVIVAAVIYVVPTFILPVLLSENPITRTLAEGLRLGAPLVALGFLALAPLAAVRQFYRRRLLDAQADLNSIRNLSWNEFEKLVAEAFQRMGYAVTEHGGAGADGGVDLIAKGKSEELLVQCKHWRTQMVGVPFVRELYGVMVSEGASGAALVTSGSFSDDAIAFAAGKPIQLIDGAKLEQLVLSVKTDAASKHLCAPPAVITTCPDCGSEMVKRTARKGKNAGQQFWGCSRYPGCRGTRQMA